MKELNVNSVVAASENSVSEEKIRESEEIIKRYKGETKSFALYFGEKQAYAIDYPEEIHPYGIHIYKNPQNGKDAVSCSQCYKEAESVTAVKTVVLQGYFVRPLFDMSILKKVQDKFGYKVGQVIVYKYDETGYFEAIEKWVVNDPEAIEHTLDRICHENREWGDKSTFDDYLKLENEIHQDRRSDANNIFSSSMICSRHENTAAMFVCNNMAYIVGKNGIKCMPAKEAIREYCYIYHSEEIEGWIITLIRPYHLNNSYLIHRIPDIDAMEIALKRMI